MRITFLLTQSLESPGGSGRFLPLAIALTQRGHQVTILALHHDYRRLQQKRFSHHGVSVHYVGQMHVRKVGSDKFYFSPPVLLWITLMATLKLTWHAWRTPADVLHVCKSQPMNGVAAWICRRLSGIPVYIDSDDYEAGNNHFSGRWQQRLVAAFEDWMPSFAAGLTVGNHFIAQRFIDLGYPADRIRIVPNGVPRQRFTVLHQPNAETELAHRRQSLPFPESEMAETSLIVYVGTLSLVSHPIDLLLEAFAHLDPAWSGRLLLVGPGKDLPAMQTLAEGLGIRDRIHFVGRVAPDEVPWYYRLARFTVDPRRATVAAESSLSLKLVESIAAGVPCITTDIGDRREIGGDACLTVPADDVEALAQAMATLLQDDDRYHSLKEAAEKAQDSHYWESRVANFAAIYDRAETSARTSAVRTKENHV